MNRLHDVSKGRRATDTGSNSLRKLKRKDLLTIMYRQQERIEELEEKITVLEGQLNNRELMLSDLGSIAEASLKLNGVFEAAQKAADQYIENARIQAATSTNGRENG